MLTLTFAQYIHDHANDLQGLVVTLDEYNPERATISDPALSKNVAQVSSKKVSILAPKDTHDFLIQAMKTMHFRYRLRQKRSNHDVLPACIL